MEQYFVAMMDKSDKKRGTVHQELWDGAVPGATVGVEVSGETDRIDGPMELCDDVMYRNENPDGGGPYTDLDVLVGPAHPYEEGLLIVCERGYKPRAYQVDKSGRGIYDTRRYVGRVVDVEIVK